MLPDRRHLWQQSVAAGFERYQPRASYRFVGMLSVVMAHQSIVLGMDYKGRRRYVVCCYSIALDHIPVLHGALIALGHGMHCVQHFPSQLLLKGAELHVDR